MKRIFSIVLALALICSCVALSAVSVSATGANLLGDTSKWIAGDWSTSTAVPTSSTVRAIYSDVINVEPGASYTFTFSTGGQWYKLIARTYDADGNITGNKTLSGVHAYVGTDNTGNHYTVTTDIPDGVYKLGIGIFKSSGSATSDGIISMINSGSFNLSIVKNDDTKASSIKMASGAAMRIDNVTDGIRFTATVDKTAFDEQVTGGTVTEIGTLIAKAGTDISKVIVDNAVDSSDGAKELTGDQIPVAKYADGTTMQTAKDTDYYIIVGSLVEIDPKNATQKYVARAYVKYVDKTGGKHIMYASTLSDARSIAEVAHNIISADSTDGYYSSLCQNHKDVVDKWAAYMK